MTSFRRLASILGVAAVALVAARGSVAAPVDLLDPADPLAAEVHELHDDISLANLVRGLNLTADQRAALAALAADADEVRARYADLATPLLAEADASFAALRDELLVVDRETDPATRQRAVAAQRDLQALRAQFLAEMATLETDVRGVLDEGQARIVEEFTPCLVPPESLDSPARVGQSGATTRAVELLDGVRGLPPTSYRRRLPEMVDRGIERIEWTVGPLTPEAEEHYRAAITAVFDEARGMDDLTFAVEGTALAERLHATHEAAAGGPPRPPNEAAQLSRVGRLLLSPGASDVLAALASGPPAR